MEVSMNKINFFFFIVFSLVSNIFGQANKLLVVVAPFSTKAGYTQDEGDAISELVSMLLVEDGNIDVFTRTQFDKLVAEQIFQASGYTMEENYARMGAAINANVLVSGSLMKLGNRTILTSSLMDIESGKILLSSRLQLANIDEAFDEIPKLVNDLIGALPIPDLFLGEWRERHDFFKFYPDGTFECSISQVYYFTEDKKINERDCHRQRNDTKTFKGHYTFTRTTLTLVGEYTWNGRFFFVDNETYSVLEEEKPFEGHYNREVVLKYFFSGDGRVLNFENADFLEKISDRRWEKTIYEYLTKLYKQ
jgi:TolB-like protein